MKNILLFGAGKSATVLIHYLLQHAASDGYHLTVVDAQLEAVQKKTANHPHSTAKSFDIHDKDLRGSVVEKADVVISLMPPALHLLIALDCLHYRKHLLTASYIDNDMQQLKPQIEAAGLLFLCEMGLDPGIDHMSAKKMLDEIKNQGGTVTSFLSHCGGLVAPESDDNPWHYKISWNPKNVVHAGKNGAVYRLNGATKKQEYEDLFQEKRYVLPPGTEPLCWYPNRDSLSYIPLYELEEAGTFIRTTLRHPDFMYGWKNLLQLQLTSSSDTYQTEGKTLMDFFKEHMERHQFGNWLEQKLSEQFNAAKELLNELANLVKLEEKASQRGLEPVDEFMMVDDKGDLQNIDIDQLKVSAASTLAERMHDANLTLKQLYFLGMDDAETFINLGTCSAADVLQFALEKKLMLQPGDKDLVVMLHEIDYIKEGKKYKATGSLVLPGENDQHTAMAKTVGLPLGIAARQLLQGTLNERGLHLPITPAFYRPVLQELEENGVSFIESTVEVNK